MTSPFASPPPPYSPQHPHVVMDHEKLSLPCFAAPPPLLPGDMGGPAGESPKPRGMRGKDGDIFHLDPEAALTLLARGVELLVSLTGDVPPTPPPSTPVTPCTLDDVSSTTCAGTATGTPKRTPGSTVETTGYFFGAPGAMSQGVDGVNVKRGPSKYDIVHPVDTPDSPSAENGGISVIHGGVGDEQQHAAISRKFWCRTAPDIGIEDYLFRIHRFCPLSTAVYLATSVYLHRLSVELRIIPITNLNVHRLILAALRVASKTLEDMSYPHRRFAKVGGLSELELSRLEVSFAFLMNFNLKVDRQMLERQVEILRQTVERQVTLGRKGLSLGRRRSSACPADADRETVNAALHG